LCATILPEPGGSRQDRCFHCPCGQVRAGLTSRPPSGHTWTASDVEAVAPAVIGDRGGEKPRNAVVERDRGESYAIQSGTALIETQRLPACAHPQVARHRHAG